MIRDTKLIKIPLQFFGAPEDDFDDDLGYEEEDAEDYEDEEDEDSDGSAEDNGDSDDSDENENADDAADGGKAANDHADLIADLKALGFKGDDLDALKADVKARREAKEKGDSAEERRAAQAAGKSHIKGSKPGRSASGELLEGFTARDIAEVNACLKNPNRGEKGRARAALERAVRAK